ncbi:hypothetical protein PoB_005586400 [Plakobranchus ocellatus]|uniref:Uncharacterized protein n=1 Tax=Plakobranchus ocellatus TaxID=259542 RepID=A0AAV4C9W4_9GAST|nr:hypothetical protein PoB_005586400 [Plakobranchus ocellatus]
MKTVFTKLKYGKAHERHNRPLSQVTKYQINATTRLLNCAIPDTARLCLLPQQMLLSATHWPRNTPEKQN